MIKRNLRDSYKYYLSIISNPVDIKEYLLINADYNKFLLEKVLEGHEITLPSRMGTLCVVGKKQKINVDENGNITGLAPDWVKTKKLWDENAEAKAAKKRIFHTNEDTDNTRYKFFWSKSRVLVTNKTLYSLRMTRDNKRAVHNAIKNGSQFITR